MVRRHLPSLSSPYCLGLWPEQTGHPGRKPGWACRLVGAGGGEGSQETRVTQSAFILWETCPFFWLFAFQTFFHLAVPGLGQSWLSGIQCRHSRQPKTQSQTENPGWEREPESPHLSSPTSHPTPPSAQPAPLPATLLRLVSPKVGRGGLPEAGDPGAAKSLPTLSLLCRCGPLGGDRTM